MDEGISPGALFEVPEEGELDPRPIAKRLVASLEEFDHLRQGDAGILYLMRTELKIRGQKAVLGEMSLPFFRGGLADIGAWALAKVCGGELPDFVCWLDAEWWRQATARQREALVYHELCHCAHAVNKDGEPKFTDEGLPVWAVVGHDVEEFSAVARRYGAWTQDLELFMAALTEGGASRG